ncbi:hypothetical protein NSK11_contig00198-0014 [Nocardia seriolae]|uniref:Uncharacterized protein n=1 Tax=Nocardia seriolae TaxID=37332 RepID=A0ABC9Z527_9NOCA|nr:hypothetical protein NSERKGN1266_71450 [Nocardia seriolae]BEK93087.1 hypothetical protein NSER024013_09930 [Nocardia seriolae]GAM51049.1 hypothetical protein NS07_v2contig00197-0013 [Nocardia seriolae]GAP32997.1 hypothetical protein NSK11_contig00198-0014 [Nocardia seriolae]GEM27881.1 hypothetical protein NS2_61200 [Nocardia seriolae NBRC 15557]
MSALTGDRLAPVRIELTAQQVESRRRQAEKILGAKLPERLPESEARGPAEKS